jgi:hypothetical protein
LPPTAAPPATKKPTPAPATRPADEGYPPAANDSAIAPAEPPPGQKPSDGLFMPKKADEVSRHEDEDKDEGTDQFKIGPVIGTGIPSVFSFGGTLKLTRFLGGGINVGLIPTVKLSYYGDATLSYQHYDIYGRLYPFGGGFFLSGGAGYATVDGTLTSTKTITINGVTGTFNYNSKGSVRTLMLTALIGYFYTTSIGFSFGIDAGAQIPIAPSEVKNGSTHSVTASMSGPAGDVARMLAEAQADDIVKKTDASIHDSLEKIGRSTIPTVNLRIGWIL